jgi:hypothetical protein
MTMAITVKSIVANDFFDGGGGAKKHLSASNQWRRGFLHRCGISIRTPHPKRHPAIDDERRTAFAVTMIQILTPLPRATVLNMDKIFED